MKKATAIYRCTLCLLAAALLLTGCSRGGQGKDAGEGETMNIDFVEAGLLHNGTEYRSYQVEEGQRGIISVGITRESGCLDLDIYPADREGNAAYTGRDLDSAEFEVILSEPGEYKVRVTAKSFLGDYGFSWRIEDAAVDSHW